MVHLLRPDQDYWRRIRKPCEGLDPGIRLSFGPWLDRQHLQPRAYLLHGMILYSSPSSCVDADPFDFVK